MKLSTNTAGLLDLTFAAIRSFMYEMETTGGCERTNEGLATDIYDIWQGKYPVLNGDEFQWKSLYNRNTPLAVIPEKER